MPKVELLKLLAARGIDVETPKVQSELIENADLDTEDICIPTWDEENILTKVWGAA